LINGTERCGLTLGKTPFLLSEHLGILLDDFGWGKDQTCGSFCDGRGSCVDERLGNGE
jgi:hypothetical protein